MMREIIAPINSQIVEIKKMYESTKKLAEEVAGSVGDFKNMTERGETMKRGGNPNASFQHIEESFGNYKV